MDEQNHQKTTTSLQEWQQQSERGNEWRQSVASSLARLATHYYRPDFTPEQAKHAALDFFADLARYSAAEIDQACARYRQDPDNSFYPTPGKLLALLRPEPHESRSRLDTFKGWPALQGPRATKSVGQILREKGFERAASKWENTQ